MLRIVIISVIMLALCVIGLCFNILFKKNGKFPDGEIGHNKALRKQGIVCFREEDERIWGKSSHIQLFKENKKKPTPNENCYLCNSECELKEIIK